MIRFNRTKCPIELKDNWIKWTRYFLGRRKKRKGTFYWNKYPNAKGKPISTIILKELLTCTQNHCAYCDKFPLYSSDKTVDHFKPKSIYPLGAYQWENFFPACDNCQTVKLNKFTCEILKPDELNYDFNNFFLIDFTTYKIIPNPRAIRFDRKRANVTIEIFKLNDLAHLVSRRHQFERYKNLPISNRDINDFAYRYLF